MTTFLVIEDEQHKALINRDVISMIRIKRADDGTFPVNGEIELEFIGGSKTKLFGEPASHLLSALSSGLKS